MKRQRYNPAFADMLENERRRQDLPVAAFAGRLDISPSYYAQIRAGYVPPPKRIRLMAAAYGAELREWVQQAGLTDELGGAMGEVVTATEPRWDMTVVGNIGDHGIVEFGAEGAPEEGTPGMRFALRSVSALQCACGIIERGDVLHFETVAAAKRRSLVLALEPDGTRRLVRLVRVDPENPELLTVLPADAPALPKPAKLKARIIARLVGLVKD